MKTFKMGEKTAVYLSIAEMEDSVGFRVADYVTLALGIKRLYALYDAVLTEFDGEFFAAEGYEITPLRNKPDADRITDVEEDCALIEYCDKYLTENGD